MDQPTKAIGMHAVVLAHGTLIAVALVIGITTSTLAAPRAYVPNFFDDTVSVVDTATKTVVATVPVGDQPIAVAMEPGGTAVWVSNASDGTVSRIATATNSVTTTIPVAVLTGGLVMHPTNGQLFVTVPGGWVAVVHTALGLVVDTIPADIEAYTIAQNLAGTRLYVVNVVSRSVTVIDATSRTRITTVPIPVGVDQYPGDVVVRPDGRRAYITASNGIHVLDTSTNTIVASVALPAGASSPAIDPSGRWLYAVSGNSLCAFALADGAPDPRGCIGAPGGNGLVVTADGTRLLVVDAAADALQIYDTSQGTIGAVIAGVPVGDFPWAFGSFIAPTTGVAMTAATGTWTMDVGNTYNLRASRGRGARPPGRSDK